MVFPAFSFDAPDYNETRKLARLGVGGFCTYMGGIKPYVEFITALQKDAKIPFLISCDFEDGSGQQVKGANLFPTNMAVAATGDPKLAFLKGKITSLDAAAVGVNWVYGPVADCNTNPLNPVINTRAFSDDPRTVIRFAREFMRGLATYRTLNSIKHFPGHGDPSIDSHLGLPRLNFSRSRIERVELAPFKALLPVADSVMIGHMIVKCFDSKRVASLSYKIITELLRKKLKYNGVITTDALMMGAVTSSLTDAKAVEYAVEAGADILLFPREPAAAVVKVQKMVESGKFSEDDLDSRVLRILKIKARAGLFRPLEISYAKAVETIEQKSSKEAMRRIAEMSVTLVRNKGNIVPLKTNSVHYVRIHDESAVDAQDVFESHLKKYADIRENSDICIATVFFKPRPFIGKTGLEKERIIDIMRQISRRKVVLISFGSPYVIRQFKDVDVYVCAYSDTVESQNAVARAIFGKIPFKGRLPVRL